MPQKFSGKITSIFPDDINTDDIIPAWVLQESVDRKFFKKYAFSNYDKDFVSRCEKERRNIIVAGQNFGCGSSREQAVYALQENNVVAVIAKSFPDIFYRNSLNNGLVLLPVKDISHFKLGQIVEIDLVGKKIIVDGKRIDILLSDEDAKIFSIGGKLGEIKLWAKRKKEYHAGDYLKSKIKFSSPKTIVEKIISDHLKKEVSAGEKIKILPIDLLFFNEVIAPGAIVEFKKHFEKISKKIFDPGRVIFIPDHTVPASSVAVANFITMMEEFAKEKGAKCYREGDGIEHIVLAEDGYIVPGEIILGTDSHTCTNGAFNTLAFGVGTMDAAIALATGGLFDFTVPQTIRFNLFSKFKKGTFAKDLILFLLGKMGVDGAVKRIIEFGGPGLKSLSMDARATIANMAVEMGARSCIFEPDEILADYLKGRARYKYRFYSPDRGCKYEKVINVDLSKIEPLVAFPHKPSNVKKASQIKDLRITDAFLGSCTNSRYEDFLSCVPIIKGRKVDPGVNFIVIPGSRKIYKKLLDDGILDLFVNAGANIESPNCGLCFGKHMGVVGDKAKIISTSNRNYIGRMGSPKAKIYLASPATVCASAIAGKIVDARKFL